MHRVNGSNLTSSFTEGILHCEMDEKGMIRYTNKQFRIVSGYEKSELIGKPCETLLLGSTPEGVRQELWSRLRHGRTWEGLLRFLHKGGGEFWAFVQAHPPTAETATENYVFLGRPASADEIAEKTVEYIAKSIQEKARN